MTIEKSAVLSDCGEYRYELRRVWDEKKALVNIIGLNPSTADASVDDPTIRRCIGFARSWGYGGLIMTNLFAYRLTDSKRLQFVRYPTGAHNLKWVESAAKECALVVAAWGRHPMARLQSARICHLLDPHDITLHCIKQTVPGVPWHPLYLRSDLVPVKFEQ